MHKLYLGVLYEDKVSDTDKLLHVPDYNTKQWYVHDYHKEEDQTIIRYGGSPFSDLSELNEGDQIEYVMPNGNLKLNVVGHNKKDFTLYVEEA